MLVLTRKSNQSIMIGDDIEVSVLSIMGRKSASGSRPRGTFRCSVRRSTSRSSRRTLLLALPLVLRLMTP